MDVGLTSTDSVIQSHHVHVIHPETGQAGQAGFHGFSLIFADHIVKIQVELFPIQGIGKGFILLFSLYIG